MWDDRAHPAGAPGARRAGRGGTHAEGLAVSRFAL